MGDDSLEENHAGRLNLMARNADGEFQANFNSNAFMGRLKAFKLIGAFPYSGMDQRLLEICAHRRCTAAAILKLIGNP